MIIDKIANFFAQKILRQPMISHAQRGMPTTQLPLLSIDVELTELDTRVAKITSIGWVQGQGFDADLSTAYYQIVRASGDLKQSPVIHGLLAKDIAGGQHIKEQLDLLKAFAKTHVWVFHNANLDVKVLNRLWKVLQLEPVTVTTIDTMLLEVYVMEKTHGFVPSGEVTLMQSRAHYGLLPVPAHNALDDALATLTLLFAQLYGFDKTGLSTLADLSHTRAIKAFNLG